MNPAALHVPSPGDGKLFWVDHFLGPRQCAVIKEELRFAHWWSSSVTHRDGHGGLATVMSPMRVSWSTEESWFTPVLLRLMRSVTRRLAPLVPGITDRREPWQATRYGAGGKFDYHCDAGHWRGQPGGERQRTVLIYLDSPRRGGATRFSELGLEVGPRAGRLVVWSNLDRYGRCDERMRHTSAPLAGGRKTVLVTWVRQRRFR